MQEKGAAHGWAVFRRREHAAIGILEHSLRKPLAFLKEGHWQIDLKGYNPMRHGSTGRNPGDHSLKEVSRTRRAVFARKRAGCPIMARSAVQSELQLYLREINEVALLSAAEEKDLGWRIVNDGCPESKERMIKANLRLVIAIGKNYVNRGLPLVDLIEEGNIGLIRAVEGFDPAQGARFSTYASWWIKQSIKRMLVNASQPIHIPAYMVDLIAKWRATRARLEERFDRTPNSEEIAQDLGIPMRKVHAIKRAMKAVSAPNQSPSGNDDESPDLAEMCEDTRCDAPEDPVVKNEEFELVLQMLDQIDARDARVLRLRYGLEGQEPLTLKEIGREVGLTRERVRQIEMEALRRIQAQMLNDRPQRFLRKNGSSENGNGRHGRSKNGQVNGRSNGHSNGNGHSTKPSVETSDHPLS